MVYVDYASARGLPRARARTADPSSFPMGGAPPAKRRKGAAAAPRQPRQSAPRHLGVSSASDASTSFSEPHGTPRRLRGRARTISVVASELGVLESQVVAAVDLMDDECTVPFIARYRKEATGGMDEAQLRSLVHRVTALDKLEARRDAILDALGKMNPDGAMNKSLERAILDADAMNTLEDLYLPYRPKRATRAAAAASRGLKPLAAALVDPRGCEEGGPRRRARAFLSAEVPTVEAALAGARDIIAEEAAEAAGAREAGRQAAWRTGRLVTKAVPSVATTGASSASVASKSKGAQGKGRRDAALAANERSRARAADAARDYASFSRDLRSIQPHQTLAIARAEAAGVLRGHVAFDEGPAERAALFAVAPKSLPPAQAAEVREAVRDGVRRLLRPAVEREVRATLREEALARAVADFGTNLRALLLAPPMRPPAAVVGLDPAYRTGCKLAAVDATGALLDTAVVHLPGCMPRGGGGGGGGGRHRDSNRNSSADGAEDAAVDAVRAFCRRHGARAVAIGDGVGTREAERLVAAAFGARPPSGKGKNAADASESGVGWRVVSEAGASVYSASELAATELPHLDVSLRGAVSIARRLQDPMAELVKIDPASLGVGLYQHDVKDKALAAELAATVESAVAAAGASLNTASAALLARVPGLTKTLATRIVAHRETHSPFADRAGLLAVKGVGAKTFQQAAGFLRVPGASEALEVTGVHPESYPVARRAVARLLETATKEAGIEFIRARGGEGGSAPRGDGGGRATNDRDVVVIDEEEQEDDDDVITVGGRVDKKRKREPAGGGETRHLGASSDPSENRHLTLDDLAAVRSRIEGLIGKPTSGSNGVAGGGGGHFSSNAGGDPAALATLASDLGVGASTLRDILAAVAAPGVDDRRGADPTSLLRTSAASAEDLKKGDVLRGVVRNVVPFGAFVDIGVGTAGLVHRSRMKRSGESGGGKPVEPHDVLSAGQTVSVVVESVDTRRERIGLALA